MKVKRENRGIRRGEQERSLAAKIFRWILPGLLLLVLAADLSLIIQRRFFQEKVPMLFGVAPMIVLSDSMYPEIASGDLILCRKAEIGEIREGDIISFYDPSGRDGQVVTHRVYAAADSDGERVLTTKGDANESADIQKVTRKELIGKLAARLKGFGHTALFLQSAQGRLLAVSASLIVILCLFFLPGHSRRTRRIYKPELGEDIQ